MLEALIAEQVRSGFSDAVFADSLGIPRTTWYATRTGARHLTPRVVRAGVRAFPHLKRKAVLFLLSDSTQVPETYTPRIKEPSNIDAAESERTRTLVLTTDRATLACNGTARTEQGQGGSVRARGVPGAAQERYIMSDSDASGLASRAADAAEAS